jgi:hypothetical protein
VRIYVQVRQGIYTCRSGVRSVLMHTCTLSRATTTREVSAVTSTEGCTLLSSIPKDCLSKLLNSLKNTANSSYRGLDFEFVKKQVLHLVEVGSRPVVEEFEQSLSGRNVSTVNLNTIPRLLTSF